MMTLAPRRSGRTRYDPLNTWIEKEEAEGELPKAREVGETVEPDRGKSRPAFVPAQRVIEEVYPDGVPDQATAKAEAGVPRTSGAPGRPSSMHLIEIEHRARWERGETQSGVAAESRALRDWFVAKHPNAPPPSPSTIENRIRREYRQLAAKPRN
jgi:hypothetical protein